MARPLIYFGSSLNPITPAHLAMLEELIKEAQNESPRPIILLAPVFKHMFSKPDLIDYNPRIRITRLAVGELLKKLTEEGISINGNDVIISDIDQVVYNEMHRKAIQTKLDEVQGDESRFEADWRNKIKISSGTWTVLQYLMEHAKEFDIDPKHVRMAVGNDTYEDLFSGLWAEELKIFDACEKFYVFERERQELLYPLEVANKIKTNYAVKLAEMHAKNDPDALKKFEESWAKRLAKLDKIEDYWLKHVSQVREKIYPTGISGFEEVSSTKIRQDFKEAQKHLPQIVLDYIIVHELYDWAKNPGEELKQYMSTRDLASQQGGSTVSPFLTRPLDDSKAELDLKFNFFDNPKPK